LASLLSRQNEDLAAQRAEQNKFLSAKEEEKIQYERRIIEARQAREEIEQDIFSLKGSGIKVSLTDANDMARFASSLTGVRAALILAVLKVESNIGKSVGTGSFPDDMHPASREPFLRLTATLGIDPYTTAVAARPKNLKGWGGAMGPAQIMPQTWEGMSPRLAKLMGKAVPNPFELSDAMVATAVFLADRGATSAGGEREAVLRYIAGPNWQYYSWYGDRVLAVAAEYAKEGL
jgi:membrane-bound lytic murein transglycosylase B